MTDLVADILGGFLGIGIVSRLLLKFAFKNTPLKQAITAANLIAFAVYVGGGVMFENRTLLGLLVVYLPATLVWFVIDLYRIPSKEQVELKQ